MAASKLSVSVPDTLLAAASRVTGLQGSALIQHALTLVLMESAGGRDEYLSIAQQIAEAEWDTMHGVVTVRPFEAGKEVW